MLEPCRPVFRRRGTFVVFTVLATGLVAATGRRSVVGMLAGARMAQQISFPAAGRFFSSAVWDIDRLGLVVARLIVTRLLGPGEPITVVIDDTLFKRWGRQVWHAFWTHGGVAQGGEKIARGNRWVIAGDRWTTACSAARRLRSPAPSAPPTRQGRRQPRGPGRFGMVQFLRTSWRCQRRMVPGAIRW